VLVKNGGQQVAKVDLVAEQDDVAKASMWQLFKRTVDRWMTFGGE
jgi:hypothetical protein